MIFKSYGWYFLFFYPIKFSFSTVAHISCCSSNIKVSLGISDSKNAAADIFLEPPEEAEECGKELKAPRPPSKTRMIDGGVRSLCSESGE